MRPSKITLENSIRYRHNQMSPREKSEYEAELNSNPKAKRQALIQARAINELGREHIQAQLKSNWDEMTNEFRSAEVRSNYIAGIAATLLLLFTFSWLLWPTQTPDHLRLFNTYYERPFISTRSSPVNFNPNQTWNKAVEAYAQGGDQGFSRAIYLFKEVLNQPKHPKRQYIQAQFYLGISFLELSQGDSARSYLGRIIESDLDLYPDAVWYSAFSYLQEGNSEAICHQFKKFSEDLRWSRKRRQKATTIYQRFNCN